MLTTHSNLSWKGNHSYPKEGIVWALEEVFAPHINELLL